MKSYNFALCALVLFLVFSCGKEEVTTQRVDLGNEISPPFNKEVKMQGAHPSEGFTFTIAVGSNDTDLLEKFNQNSFSVYFPTDDELARENESSRDELETDSPTTEEDARDNFLEANRKYITVKIAGIHAPHSMQAVPAYKLSFADEILNILRENNAATIIDFGKIEVTSPARWGSETLWSNNKLVKIIGDGYQVNTRTNNYWNYYGQGTGNMKFLNRSNFRNTDYTSVCASSTATSGSSSRWVRRVAVVSDVIKDVVPADGDCWYGSGTLRNTNYNGCSGWATNWCN